MAGNVARMSSPRVLVVEDDRGVTRMLGFALREAGFQVCLAGSGGEALSALEAGPVDAVVLAVGLSLARASLRPSLAAANSHQCHRPGTHIRNKGSTVAWCSKWMTVSTMPSSLGMGQSMRPNRSLC